MRTSAYLLALAVLSLAKIASAYEYPLQFTPNSGYRGLVVAGYELDATGVTGNCSYYTVHGGSGRGGGYHNVTTHYDQTCRWDLFGNLLSVTPGAPAVPAPLYTNGTETVYAHNATGGYTGTDSRMPHGGFVNTQGAHYTWVTSNAYAVLQQSVYTFTLTLKSDGDTPLHITAEEASAQLAKVSVKSTTCKTAIAVGSTCSVTVTYDPTSLSTATGLAYDTLSVGVVSNAGQINDFVQSYTVAVKLSDDGD